MRIAQVAPVWFPVPPTGYGGIELVVALLADGLVDAGHDVTLFAAQGSRTKAKLVSPMAAPDPRLLGNVWFESYHAVASYLHADEFDVIHDHSGIVGVGMGALLGTPPVVHTLHGPWTDPARHYYGLLHDKVHLVAISEAQRGYNPGLRYAGVVYNGIDVTDYPFVADKEPYLVYIGRANPDKGPAIAIEVARRAGLPLQMIVKRNEPNERAYFEEALVPLLHEGVEVHENVTHAEKADLLGRAQAMIFPIQWPEPFGLVMTEAMACGTPVVACPDGAAVELVEEGVTGYLRTTVDDLVTAVLATPGLDPAACRERVEQRFSATAMVAGYERVFEQVVSAGS